MRTPPQLSRLKPFSHKAINRPCIHKLIYTFGDIRHLCITFSDVYDFHAQLLGQGSPLLTGNWQIDGHTRISSNVQQRLLDQIRNEPRIRTMSNHRSGAVAKLITQGQSGFTQCIIGTL